MSIRKQLEQQIQSLTDRVRSFDNSFKIAKKQLEELTAKLSDLPEEHMFVPGRTEGFYTPSISGEKNLLLWKGASIQDVVFNRCVERGVICEKADDAVEISVYLQVQTKIANLAKQLNRKNPPVNKARYEIFAEGTRIEIVYSNVHSGISFNTLEAAEKALSCLTVQERLTLLRGIK